MDILTSISFEMDNATHSQLELDASTELRLVIG